MTPTPQQEVWDFETIFPNAAKAVFQATGADAFTVSDDPDYQKVRPRTEIVYKHSGVVTPVRFAVITIAGGGTVKRPAAFRGDLTFYSITDCDAPGKLAHSSYRATVRDILAGLMDSLNGSALTKHRINFITEQPEVHGIREKDGFEQTTFPFTIEFAVQADAWTALFSN